MLLFPGHCFADLFLYGVTNHPSIILVCSHLFWSPHWGPAGSPRRFAQHPSSPLHLETERREDTSCLSPKKWADTSQIVGGWTCWVLEMLCCINLFSSPPPLSSLLLVTPLSIMFSWEVWLCWRGFQTMEHPGRLPDKVPPTRWHITASPRRIVR